MERNDREYINDLIVELSDVGIEMNRLHKVVRVVRQWREHVIEESGSAADIVMNNLLCDAYDDYIAKRG